MPKIVGQRRKGESVVSDETRLKRKKGFFQLLWRDRYLYIIIMPVIVHLFIFQYLPMYGMSIAFKSYKIGQSMFELGSDANWVGFYNFIKFFRSVYFFRVIKNTLLNSGSIIIFGFWVPIVFALLLNEIKNVRYKKIIQTLSYMPYFVSTVIVAGIVLTFLSAQDGVVNSVLINMGYSKIQFMNEAKYFRGIYVSTNIWKTFGWNSIIYLAAISSINQDMYEASKIDGANRWRQIWHITLPGIQPTISILLILSVGNLMSDNMEMILLLYNPAIYNTADVIGTYTFREGIRNAYYSYATAVGIFTAVVNFILLSFANRTSKRISGDGLW